MVAVMNVRGIQNVVLKKLAVTLGVRLHVINAVKVQLVQGYRITVLFVNVQKVI